MKEWLSVSQYSEKIGKSRQQVYMDIRLGKIPKEKIRAVKIKELIEIEYEENK